MNKHQDVRGAGREHEQKFKTFALNYSKTLGPALQESIVKVIYLLCVRQEPPGKENLGSINDPEAMKKFKS